VTNTKMQKRYDLGTKMSFRTGSLEQDVIIFCPVTGIIGKLEMPWLPVNLSYVHPLADAKNVLLLLRKYFERKRVDNSNYLVTSEMLQKMFLEIDRQVLAGCVLSLLREKHLLRTEVETTAVEQNLVLQNAGSDILCRLLSAILERWENPQVWKRMPGLNVEYSLFADARDGEYSTHIGIAPTLQEYTKLLRNALNPEELTREEAAKIFAAQKRAIFAGRRIKIYSASAVQHRNIKDTKSEAYKLLDQIKPQLTIVLRTRLSKALRDMLVLPIEYKFKLANELFHAHVDAVSVSARDTLARILQSSTTDRILDEIGTLSQEVSPTSTKRTIAEILAAKQAKAEDKAEHEQERDIIIQELGSEATKQEPEEFGFDDDTSEGDSNVS